MNECPKCKKEINRLIRTEKSTVTGQIEIGVPGTCDLDQAKEFSCPECKGVLFLDDWEAMKFLRGE